MEDSSLVTANLCHGVTLPGYLRAFDQRSPCSLGFLIKLQLRETRVLGDGSPPKRTAHRACSTQAESDETD